MYERGGVTDGSVRWGSVVSTTSGDRRTHVRGVSDNAGAAAATLTTATILLFFKIRKIMFSRRLNVYYVLLLYYNVVLRGTVTTFGYARGKTVKIVPPKSRFFFPRREKEKPRVWESRRKEKWTMAVVVYREWEGGIIDYASSSSQRNGPAAAAATDTTAPGRRRRASAC